MYSLNHSSNIGSDDLSVEVNSDGFPLLSDLYDPSIDVDLTSLFDSDLLQLESNVAGYCDSTDLLESINASIEPNEFNKYLGPKILSSLTHEIDQNLLVNNSLPVYNKTKKIKSNKKTILLSSSVGIGIPQRSFKPFHQIEIVYDLEEKYRPRYKSDYFSQNGKTRKPRYVTDRHGNHYVTVKVSPGVQGQIRIDWLTVPTENGKRYFMPYRFQANNESTDVADCNPIFEKIVADSSGLMKLYLVLIKTKQDALKTLQPLQPFQPMKDVFGIIDKDNPEKIGGYTPKKLIQTYQLGKSQLAFTLCTLSADGQSYITEWDTTVYSTVMEEEANEGSIEKSVACPNCSHEISINDDDVIVQETKNKRKSLGGKVEKSKTIKKQKKLSNEIYCFT